MNAMNIFLLIKTIADKSYETNQKIKELLDKYLITENQNNL